MNKICYDCKLYKNKCNGTENETWTGCVYKSRAEKEYVMNIQRKTKGRKISAMWDEFGILHGKCCGDCCHLIQHRHERAYYKCEIYGKSSSEATDWVKGWTACRAYNVTGITKTDLYKSLWHGNKKQKTETPLDGQIKMEV